MQCYKETQDLSLLMLLLLRSIGTNMMGSSVFVNIS